MDDGDEGQGPGTEQTYGVYVCDLQPGLTDAQLRDLFERFGDIAALEQVDDACDEAVIVEYTTSEAAEEAQDMLNCALVRGKTSRCLSLEKVESVQQSLETGQRLLAQNLDPSMEGRGFRELCALFGDVLDCKVELDGTQKSRGFGFVHYAKPEHSRKALLYLNKLRVGQSSVELRAFSQFDFARFTGCGYFLGSRASTLGEDDDEKLLARTPLERAQAAMEYCKELQYHHVEVIDSAEAKVQRLKALMETYTPNQDRQMIIISSAEELPAVKACVGSLLEDADYDSVGSSQSKEERQALVMGFQTGNIFIMVLTDEICIRRDFEFSGSSAVLVNFSLPNSVDKYLYRIYRRAEPSTRIHSLFLPSVDGKLAQPLLGALQELAHDIPDGLMALWSKEDQEGT